MKCPNCDFDNRPDAHYCGMCGTRLTRACPACGNANANAYRYCIQCGSALESASPRPTPAKRAAELPKRAAELPKRAAELPKRAAELPKRAAELPKRAAEPPLEPPDQSEEQPLVLEGERRVATIILADVKGSTDLLEQLGTETWVEVMNQVFQILEKEVYRFGGKVDQFRGDGLVAFFGTTSAHEDDPERAVLAALSMQKALQQYAEQLHKMDDIELALRVGVNTGEVIVASVGDDRRYSEETAMGEAVALAARMETAAQPGTVLVSENTHHLVQQRFEWQPLGKITVKGIRKPVAVYRPMGLRADAEHAEVYELASPLVGREAELETLKSYIEDLRDGLGGIVTLTGEQGMGKSLLVSEVRQYFARQRALLAEAQDAGQVPGQWIHGRCRSYTQSQPYAVWQDLLRNWLGVRKDEPKNQTRERLRQQCEALWGENAPDYYPDLAAFLSLPLETAQDDPIQRLDAEDLRQRFFHTLRNWIEVLVQQEPLILSFGDMQWADSASLELLQYCLPLCDYADLLWLFVFRPDRTSPVWEFNHYLETEYPHRLLSLTLAPLTPGQSEQFVNELIGPDVLPEKTLELIVEKAEGNPYYIQELIRSLIAQGVLSHDPESDRWRTHQAVTSLSLPESLQSLLLARIDRLTPEQQHVLQMAAAVGAVFWANVLEALMTSQSLPPDHLKAHMTALQRAQLIRERGRVPDLGIEYVFKSSLIRDAAYDSLLSAQRAGYHLQIAQYIEKRCCLEEDEQYITQFYGTLAYHYHHAGKPKRELHYILEGAEQAQRVYANAEAAKLYAKAIELLQVMEMQAKDEAERHALQVQRFEALNARRAMYHLMGKFDAMRQDAQALLPLARQLGDDPAWLIDALLQQPGVADYQSQDEIDAGIPMAQEALKLAQQTQDRRREMACLIAIVNQRLALSDSCWHKPAERALELAQELSDLHYEARLLIGMGGIYAFSDEPERSMEYLEAAAALAMSQAMDDKVIQMSLLNLLGLEFERSGDYYRLLTEYQEERLHISREIGHRPIESKALQACGRIRGLYLGDYERALVLLDECRMIVHNTQQEVYPLFHIAHIQIEQGDYAAAKERLRRIHEIGPPVQDRGRASLSLIKAILYNALGDEAHLHMALDLCAEVSELSRQNPLISRQYEMAAACKAVVSHLKLNAQAPGLDHRQQALGFAELAHDIYQSFGFAQIVECVSEEVYFRYSQALAANGDDDLASKYLRRAYDEMTHKHGLIPPESYLRRTYLEAVPLHQEIRKAYAARVGSILTESEFRLGREG